MGLLKDLFSDDSNDRYGGMPNYMKERLGCDNYDSLGTSSGPSKPRSGKKWVCPRCGTTNYWESDCCHNCGNLNPYS